MSAKCQKRTRKLEDAEFLAKCYTQDSEQSKNSVKSDPVGKISERQADHEIFNQAIHSTRPCSGQATNSRAAVDVLTEAFSSRKWVVNKQLRGKEMN